ncbi:MAG: extracellular solute-binding protein, partial [Desulfobacterales bacterium]|nr:extracellular solute-binding protein [Desulfobacterales bacterium]
MNRSGIKYFTTMILAIAFTVALPGPVKAQAPWEAEWQKTVAAGKKEGKVSGYVGLLAPALRKEAAAFTKEFGIQIDITPGRGSDLTQKLRTENAAGMHIADFAINGSNTMLATKKMGVTAPLDSKLILPEVTNTKLWYTLDRLPWLDEDKHLFYFYAYPNRDIAINTDLVKPGEIQSWQDLLKPQYKG